MALGSRIYSKLSSGGNGCLMEEEIYCKQLKTIYVEDNGLLSGPLFSDVELYDGYHITIEQ